MNYFHSFFSPQAHKIRSGYYINHDTLMAVNPEDRRKLIFYFIAEQTPLKLSADDRKAYKQDSFRRLSAPVSTITAVGFLFPLIPLILRIKKISKLGISLPYFIGYGLAASFGAMVGNTLGWRIYQASMIEASETVSQLSKKYNFGIYDFTIAKKESHINSILRTYDCSNDTLHVTHEQI